jgi:hypothetical protein
MPPATSSAAWKPSVESDGRSDLAGHVLGAPGRDGGQDGEAERAADLLGRVDQPAGQPGLVLCDAVDGADGERHERRGQPDRSSTPSSYTEPSLPSSAARPKRRVGLQT